MEERGTSSPPIGGVPEALLGLNQCQTRMLAIRSRRCRSAAKMSRGFHRMPTDPAPHPLEVSRTLVGEHRPSPHSLVPSTTIGVAHPRTFLRRSTVVHRRRLRTHFRKVLLSAPKSELESSSLQTTSARSSPRRAEMQGLEWSASSSSSSVQRSLWVQRRGVAPSAAIPGSVAPLYQAGMMKKFLNHDTTTLL
ncbi:MAG: hypothetical protein QOI66_4568 [Myxococcales bacterium]|jgi:hypothetical protein|nr:hypothetical protein [Myxococcales bacterium]